MDGVLHTMPFLKLAVGALSLSTAVAAVHPRPVARGPWPAPASPRPFRVGGRLTDQAKLNFLNAGSATMSVEGIERVRGRTVYHTIFDVHGKVLLFKVKDHYESWFDTTDLSSLRMVMDIEQGSYEQHRSYEFYPERSVYVRNGEEEPGVSQPLDEGSFLYFLRTIPLEVGRTYEFKRYYHLDRNPVIIKVVGREHIKVPAGEFDAIVVQPTIKSKGLFSENGKALVWFSDDSSRRILRLKSGLSFGTLSLELKSVELASRQ